MPMFYFNMYWTLNSLMFYDLHSSVQSVLQLYLLPMSNICRFACRCHSSYSQVLDRKEEPTENSVNELIAQEYCRLFIHDHSCVLVTRSKTTLKHKVLGHSISFWFVTLDFNHLEIASFYSCTSYRCVISW